MNSELSNQKVNDILKEAYANMPSQEYFNVLRSGECEQLCSSGKCKADCCGCVSFLDHDFRKLKKLIPDEVEYYEHRFSENGSVHVKPITKNFKCVFLSKENSCLIYKSNLRPSYCKRFGEDKVQPLFACVHINQELKSEIEEFARIYLANQTQNGNPLAKVLLEQTEEPAQDKN